MNRVNVGIVAVVIAATVPCWLASARHDADALRDGSYRDGFQWSKQVHPDATACADEAMRRTGPQVSASAWLNGWVEALDLHR
ncbi:MAG TPA: hypothetical protein VNA67_03915 [Pseudonocardiaceae bacterium]|nr:hypothetical protein [Pseudonocardiaceae bacterium]